MKTPIERITGFACEIDQSQWEELVRVADGVGLYVGHVSRTNGTEKGSYPFASIRRYVKNLCTFSTSEGNVLIPYPEFLSKLKGEEKWEPKNGEEVEVSNDYFVTCVKGSYVGKDEKISNYVIRFFDGREIEYVGMVGIRPARPAITRLEAEAILNKRIID